MTYHYPLLGSLLVTSACLPVSLDPVISGSAPLATASAGDDSGLTGETDTAALTESGPTEPDTGPTSDTGECETACTPEAESFACVNGIAWGDGPIGVSNREIADGCQECETKQLVLLQIDPVTGGRTLLGEGPINSWSRNLALAGDGSIFVAAERKSNWGYDRHALLLKFSADGAPVWQVKPDLPPLNDLVLHDGEVVVVDGEHELVAFSADDGALLWDIPHAVGRAAYVEMDAAGAFYVAGDDPSATDGELPSWFVRKYASDRTLLWEQVMMTGDGEGPKIDGLALDEDGGAIVSLRLDEPIFPGISTVSIHKFTADGAVAWQKPFPELVPGVPDQRWVHRIVGRPGGGALLVGSTGVTGGALVVAVDPDGETLWSDLHQLEGIEGGIHFGAVIGGGALRAVGCAYDEEVFAYHGWFLTFDP